MTAPQSELQRVVWSVLTNDTDLMSRVSGVYDSIPKNVQFPYISFGPIDSIELDASCIIAAQHTFQIDVWSRERGKIECYDICDIAKRALHDDLPVIADNALASLLVVSTRVMGDPDGLTSHGVLTVRARIEER